jgi:hypothetical protein
MMPPFEICVGESLAVWAARVKRAAAWCGRGALVP